MIGPRRLAGLIAGALALAVIATVTWLLGVEWGLLLLAGLLVLVLLAVALLYVDIRRLANGQAQASTEAATRADALADRLKRIEALVAIASRTERETREVREALRSLADQVDSRLAVTERANRLTLADTIWLYAERTRSEGDGPGEERERELELIRSSGFFDAAWYRAQSGTDPADPVAHYVDHAVRVRADPHPLFASSWYLEHHPRALTSWRTPLGHFLAGSKRQHLDPHPAFWSQWYADRYLASAEPTTLPVSHFLTDGAAAGNDPNPLFHLHWYQQQYGHLIPDGVNPLVHYLTRGVEAGLDPSPLFSTSDARRRLGALADDPLSAFLDTERDPARALGPPSVRREPEAAKVADLRWEYLVRGLHHQPDTFVLYRIIGNDLPPRHRIGQGLANLRFILDHEPELPGCEKRWVVNRIVDPQTEAQIVALLEERGLGFLRIPFDLAEYRTAGWRFAELSPPGLTYRREMDELTPFDQRRVLDHVYHDKNLYVMNNNGARNAALREGRTRAKWVLPWDGNCFLTREAWDELVRTVTTEPYFKYFVVPMARVLDNQVLLQQGVALSADEEPQLVFRGDAAEEFHPDLRYGRRPKVELFYRLGVPGVWDTWPQLPWDIPRRELSPEAGQFGSASWVARLFSGEPELEADIVGRGFSRMDAVRNQLDRLDEGLAAETFRADALFVLDDVVLGAQRDQYRAGEPGPKTVIAELVERAERSLNRPTYSVMTKTTLPPSGDRHDYWHPAPYWWPNPKTRSGLPYVWRDGERVPGTVLWEPGSERYDRSALQSMIDETTQCALAGYFTGERRYFARGAELVRAWFLDPKTRMNPHLRFAQVVRGQNGDEGHSRGIIDASDFHYLLDAIRLIEREQGLTAAEAAELRAWFREYRGWLFESAQGRGERGALNNHGTWYDVQLAAIDAFLGDLRGLLATARRAHERVGQQFRPDGSQPEELGRTQSQHYCAYNLQGWVPLATCLKRVGQDLWRYRTADGRGLEPAASWLLRKIGKPWEYPQRDPFDADRLVAFAHQVRAKTPALSGLESVDDEQRDPWRVKQVYTEHDGIRPFWVLGG